MDMLEAPSTLRVEEAQVVEATSEATGASLVYHAARPVALPSDGTSIRVPLLTQELSSSFEYAATPKLSPYAYLMTTITNAKDEQLLPGPVNVFLEGAFVGKSFIPKTLAPEEKFDLYLGVDEGVVVKREKFEEQTDDTLIGNIPSGTKRTSFKYKITVENYKPREITLKVYDQVPVASDDKIKVVKVVAEPKATAEKYKDREGVYQWIVTLKPKEKKEIILSYVIEHPRDMQVNGL
jgi:uncharacterized protein (TIGR02231 family)